MNVIKIKIDFEKGLCQKEGISVVTGDYNSTKIEFEFNESAADGRKIFELKNSDDELVYVDEIVNNEVILVGKREEEGEEKLFSLFNKEGDYTFEVSLYGENSKLTSVYDYITARKEQVIVDDETVEQYMPLFDNLMQELSNKVAEADSKIDEIDQAIEEANQAVEDAEEAVESTNNLNIDVSDKVGKDVTVTLTKKDATTKVVTLSDGTSLMFNWSGTSLGIKTDEDEEYTYVDLQGIQGPVGPMGAPFTIKKTYATIQLMIADYDNMNVGDYVMIDGDVEQQDNATLWVKEETEDPTYKWHYLADFSGATGIQGPTGLTPNIQIGTVVSGATPSVTRTGTNENPVLNFTLVKGDKGDTGPVGPTGNGIASIIKTASAGLIDTYTITFTDGTTTTFNVTNGQDGDVTQEYVDEENERLKSLYNVLPKVSDSGESVTLENTGDTMLYKMDLKGNTSQEVVQGEVGLEVEDTSIYVDDVNEDKEDYITLKGNTYQDSTSGKNLLNSKITTETKNGVTISYDEDTQIITLNGTATANDTSFTFLNNSILLNANTNYYFKAKYVSGTAPTNVFRFEMYTSGWANYKSVSLYGMTSDVNSIITTSSDLTYNIFRLRTDTGNTFNNLKIKLYLSSVDSEYEPYTNGASPNPDYPQEIEVVTGLNEVEICGKNLFDENNQQQIVINNVTGTKRYGIIVNAPNKKVSISGNWVAELAYRFITNDVYSSYTQITQNTTVDVTEKICIYVGGAGVKLSDQVKNLQIEISDTPTPYEAYKGQTYPISLDYTNLFKKQDISSDDLNKRLTPIGIGYNENGYFISPFIKVDKDTQYTINYTPTAYTRICYYASNNTNSFISRNDDTSSFTTPSTCQYLRFCNLMADIDNIRLEKGSTITNNYIELCKIGTYQDRIYKNNGNWYLHKEIGKVVLDGVNNAFILKGGNQGNVYSINQLNNLKTISSNNEIVNAIADRFKPSSYSNINNITTGLVEYHNSQVIRFKFGTDSSITTLNLANQWLSSNNVKLYYILQTPTDTQITDTTLVNQLEALYNATIYSTTHINTETSNLLPYIDLKYNVVTASPSPERASEVEVVKGNNVIKVQSKNLLPTNQIRTDKDWLKLNSDGSISISYPSGSNINFTNLFTEDINIPTGNYKLKLFVKGTFIGGNMLVFDENHNTITQGTIIDGRTFTITNKGIGNIQLYIVSAGTNCNIKLELEEGTIEPTSYVPYQSQSYNITLGNLELCKIGDYQDYFYKDNGNWYKYKEINKIIIDGTYGVPSVDINSTNTTKAIYYAILSSYPSKTNTTDVKCNNLLSSNIWSVDIEGIYTDGNNLVLRMNKSTIGTTASEIDTYMAQHNLIVYYPLATPTTTQITDQLLVSQLDELQKAMSYYDKTIITQTNADKPFILDVIAIRDLQDIFNLISGE